MSKMTYNVSTQLPSWIVKLVVYLLLFVKMVSTEEGIKCLKDEELPEYPVNVYYCSDAALPVCCETDGRPSCCEEQDKKDFFSVFDVTLTVYPQSSTHLKLCLADTTNSVSGPMVENRKRSHLVLLEAFVVLIGFMSTLQFWYATRLLLKRREQLQLWGAIIGVAVLIAFFWICYRKDTYMCEGKTMRERVKTFCHKCQGTYKMDEKTEKEIIKVEQAAGTRSPPARAAIGGGYSPDGAGALTSRGVQPMFCEPSTSRAGYTSGVRYAAGVSDDDSGRGSVLSSSETSPSRDRQRDDDWEFEDEPIAPQDRAQIKAASTKGSYYARKGTGIGKRSNATPLPPPSDIELYDM